MGITFKNAGSAGTAFSSMRVERIGDLVFSTTDEGSKQASIALNRVQAQFLAAEIGRVFPGAADSTLMEGTL